MINQVAGECRAAVSMGSGFPRDGQTIRIKIDARWAGMA
jgi:hypothetical protein